MMDKLSKLARAFGVEGSRDRVLVALLERAFGPSISNHALDREVNFPELEVESNHEGQKKGSEESNAATNISSLS